VPQPEIVAFVINRVTDESLPVGDNDNGVTAVTPSSQVMNAVAEATGIGSASSISPSGQCRIPFPDLRTESSPNLRWPSPRDASSCPRYRARARRLTPEQESKIRSLAGTKSLRSLAAQFGVSHETIRAVVRQKRAATR